MCKYKIEVQKYMRFGIGKTWEGTHGLSASLLCFCPCREELYPKEPPHHVNRHSSWFSHLSSLRIIQPCQLPFQENQGHHIFLIMWSLFLAFQDWVPPLGGPAWWYVLSSRLCLCVTNKLSLLSESQCLNILITNRRTLLPWIGQRLGQQNDCP